MSVLVASGVSAGYAEREVLHDSSLSLRRGDTVAVVGPNGAGKSTLLRVLAGLLRPFSGTVTIDGRDVGDLTRPEIARRIAVVPQLFDTLFPFTVREVVALGRTARLGRFGSASADDTTVIDRAIAELDLTDLARRRIDRLSGGERQRAVLAMALAQEADVLLLDEPTAHLDPAHQLATLDLVSRLAHDRGLAVLAVLHDLNLASVIASRIVVIAAGRIVRDAPPSEALTPDLVDEVFGSGLEVIPRNGHPLVFPAERLRS